MAYQFVDNINQEDFDNFAINNQDSVKTHFLGSYEWGVLSSQRNWTPYYVGVLKDGKLSATALLLQRKLIAGYSYFYCPRGFSMDYSDFDLLDFMIQAVSSFCKQRNGLFFRMDPDIKLHTIDIDGNEIEGESNEELVSHLKNAGFIQKPLNYAFEYEQPRFTFRTNISGDLKEIETRYSKTTLHEIRKSHECEVYAYKGSRKDIAEFNRLMKMTEARQNFFSHKEEYYYSFYDALQKSDMVDIYLGKVNIDNLRSKTLEDLKYNQERLNQLQASNSKKAQKQSKEINNRLVALKRKLSELEGKPSGEVIASAYFAVKYVDKFWTLYGANDMEYSKYFVNYAVYQKMIEDANRDGYKIFDGFGTVGKKDIDNNAIGLFEFKKKWGGELTEFIGEFDYILNKPVYFAYSKLIPIYHRIQLKKLVRSESQ